MGSVPPLSLKCYNTIRREWRDIQCFNGLSVILRENTSAMNGGDLNVYLWF